VQIGISAPKQKEGDLNRSVRQAKATLGSRKPQNAKLPDHHEAGVGSDDTSDPIEEARGSMFNPCRWRGSCFQDRESVAKRNY
jgi:hypothetical protein